MFDLLQRVKILFNKKDTALIQMAEPQQAIHAINHLDKVKLWGKAIRVMHSKHTNVQVLPLIVIFAQFFSFFLLSLVLDIFKYCYTYKGCGSAFIFLRIRIQPYKTEV